MAFDWRKKLEEGKEATKKAFTQAVETGKDLAEKGAKKANELNDKLEEGTNKLIIKAEEKILAARQKKEGEKDAAAPEAPAAEAPKAPEAPKGPTP